MTVSFTSTSERSRTYTGTSLMSNRIPRVRNQKKTYLAPLLACVIVVICCSALAVSWWRWSRELLPRELLQIDATYLDRPGPPTIMLWEEQPQTRKQITPIQRTHVQYVRFNGAVSDGAIESLVQLPALRQVHFVRVTITPKQLETLSHLSSVDEVAFLVCDLPEVSRENCLGCPTCGHSFGSQQHPMHSLMSRV